MKSLGGNMGVKDGKAIPKDTGTDWKGRLLHWVRLVNPCSAYYGDDSLAWKIMSTLFPECWCCAGVRGFLYGVIVTLLLLLAWWI